ncbi:hypothetical protein E2320_011791 [Naja naja]|nr:hypothetical protein E2320_011791 [Naja naja]
MEIRSQPNDICPDFVVLHHTLDLEFLDAVAHRDQFGSPPDKAVHLNRSDTLLHFGHVCFVVPLEMRKGKK